MKMRKYTSNLQHGGALLEDMRLLVQNWSDNAPNSLQKQNTLLQNTLAKKSKKRILNILTSTFSPRFLKGDPPNAWKILRPLEDQNTPLEVLKPIYYWISCRGEAFLYDYVREEIFPKSKTPDLSVTIDHTTTWIKKKIAQYNLAWSDSVAKRVAWGILAALRDFGILEGTQRKKIAPIYIPLEAFVYIAFALHKLENSGEKLVNHPDWTLFLIHRSEVERLFLEAHQQGFLLYAAAGNIYRIEFSDQSWPETADVIYRRTI